MVEPNIQRPATPRTSLRRIPVVLPVEDIRPVLRIAHRPTGILAMAERVILDHEFVFILKGRGELRVRPGSWPDLPASGVIPFSAHDLLFLPPFVPHAFHGDTIVEHLALHFDFSPHATGGRADIETRRPYEVRFPAGLGIPLSQRLDPADGIEADAITLLAHWQREDPRGLLTAHATLTALIARLLRVRDHAATPDDDGAVLRARLERAQDFARDNLDLDTTVADLARIAGFSPGRFSRHFHTWTGYAPMAWLRRLRVAHARTLLADLDLPVKEVARRVGFADPYHFSRVFRAVDGLAPTAYRAAVVSGRAPHP